ncbi:MAG: polysaccharide deacetylase family protein [Bacteroidales bacterium]|nr:polysaccharide deacetylase family protein [Bacteroidales bacterium]
MTVKIQIPKNNIPERRYIINVFFKEFLCIEYQIEEADTDNYKINFQDKIIEIKDAFFNQFPEDLSYLKKENIPLKVIFAENKFTTEANIPVLYGNTEIKTSENTIKCGIDIFASSFFMLTRWEENVITEKDKHGRIPDEMQFSVKNNFHYRPIVNENVEMLRNMFVYLGFNIENKHNYIPKITHDIDFFARYDRFTKVIKAIAGDVFKRKSFKKAINTLQSYFQIKKGKQKDPYDTFDYLMDISESVGQKSFFYFIPAILGEPDAKYNISDKAVVCTMENIKRRGHIVGIHGAYRSYKDAKLFKEELKRFPKEIKIEEGRQHFLRFENPVTWQIYEDAGLKTDSSIGFMSDAGFRSGTCYEYSLFNILTREKLKLKERPLIVMEQALAKKYPDKNEFYKKIIELKDTVENYSGIFVVLWHNNNFNVDEWDGYRDVYETLVLEVL